MEISRRWPSVSTDLEVEEEEVDLELPHQHRLERRCGTPGWLEVRIREKDEWKFSTTANGERSATICLKMSTPASSARASDSDHSVGCPIDHLDRAAVVSGWTTSVARAARPGSETVDIMRGERTIVDTEKMSLSSANKEKCMETIIGATVKTEYVNFERHSLLGSAHND
jgi:hypothetical protein